MMGILTLAFCSMTLTSFIEGKILRKKAKYQQGDYDYNYDGDAVHENYDATKEVELTNIPKFITTAESIMIDEGDTIKLACVVDKLDNLIMMWKKGNKIIAIGDKLFEPEEDDRTKLEKIVNGNKLTIRLAEEDDAGEYLCQVTAAETIELVHDVQIRVKPKIEPRPESGLVKVTAGKPVELSCEVTQGYPTPEVLWRRKERPMPTGEDFISGLSIYYPTTNRHHSGIYTCTADNGGDEDATAEIKLTVHHPPEIEQNKLFIQKKDENEVEIVCTVHASPAAKVEWFKDGDFLPPKKNVITRRGNKHILLLPGIMKGDKIGLYECRAKNALGEAAASTEVSIIPKPAQFTSAADGTDMTKYVLEWIVISHSEVSECNIRFKIDDGSHDWLFITASVKKAEPDTYVGKVTLEHLKPGSRYVVQIASKNGDNYNNFSEAFIFATKGYPNKEHLEEDLLSETDYLEEYETEVQQEEGSGSNNVGEKINEAEETFNDVEENISQEEEKFSEKMEIEEEVFLPVVPSEKMEIEESIIPSLEGSGDEGSGDLPEDTNSSVSTKDAADAVDVKDSKLPQPDRSTSGSRPVTFHSILELCVFGIFLLAN